MVQALGDAVVAPIVFRGRSKRTAGRAPPAAAIAQRKGIDDNPLRARLQQTLGKALRIGQARRYRDLHAYTALDRRPHRLQAPFHVRFRRTVRQIMSIGLQCHAQPGVRNSRDQVQIIKDRRTPRLYQQQIQIIVTREDLQTAPRQAQLALDRLIRIGDWAHENAHGPPIARASQLLLQQGRRIFFDDQRPAPSLAFPPRIQPIGQLLRITEFAAIQVAETAANGRGQTMRVRTLTRGQKAALLRREDALGLDVSDLHTFNDSQFSRYSVMVQFPTTEGDAMHPQEFVNKWADSALGELQSGQAHFLDVCRLVEVEMPGGDGKTENGDTFVFEQSLTQASGHGRADVFYQGHFAIEYKAPDKYKDLNAAYQQLLQYRENLNNPPLLVVTDINHWEIHTNFPNTAKQVYAFSHSQIASDPKVMGWLRALFQAPERLHPGRNTEQVTQEAAQVFRLIADNMRDWDADPRRIAYFLTKLVFCLFAEDVGLLPTAVKSPQGIFTHIIEQSRSKPGVFKQYVRNLFVAMNEGGNMLMRDIPYFNGTLFNVVTVEELSVEALTALEKAAKLNWEAIEPSIFGTLFERSLDPNKRSQLGAHYTSREDILLIVEPVLMQPLRYEWDTIQLEAEPIRERYDKAGTGRAKSNARNQLLELRERILKRIRATTVLDPACGSGNFLYVSLQLLMDLEKEVIQHPLWAGLQLPTPEVHPRQMYGIEIDPIAHALASIVVWIGYIQWRQNNGYGQAFKEPILEELQDNIVCKDAILPPVAPLPPGPCAPSVPRLTGDVSHKEGGGARKANTLGNPKMRDGEESHAKWDISPELERRMQAVARELRKHPTGAEDKLWGAIRKKQLEGRKFRRQVAIGAFVLDFYCASERLVIEVDGPNHDEQQEADRIRQQLLESLGIRFVRLSNHQVEHRLEDALNAIRAAFAPHPPTPDPPSVPPLTGGGIPTEEGRGARAARASGSPEMNDDQLHITKLNKDDESPSLLVGEGFGVGGHVDWPAVDVIVGNPPFLGNKKMWTELGEYYYRTLTKFYEDRLPGGADLVCYWFENARRQLVNGRVKRVGLLATNSIRGGSNRYVLDRINDSGNIFTAWSDREWILDGAAVRVSIICFDSGEQDSCELDGIPVKAIYSDLTADIDITGSRVLAENDRLSFQGIIKRGPFDMDHSLATTMIKSKPKNREVLKPVANGIDITRRTRHKWIVDFGIDMPLEEAKRYELPFEYVESNVKPMRLTTKQANSRDKWWLHIRPRPEMRTELEAVSRYIATPAVAKHRLFDWLDKTTHPDHALIVFPRDDDYFFGVLHSKLHEVWSLRMGTWLGKGNDPRYTPTTTFQTFPFPWSPGSEDTDHPAHTRISRAAKQLHEERRAWQNPHPPAPSPKMREGEESRVKWDISPELERRMQAVAREFRKNPPVTEGKLWQAIQKRQLDGRKFRRQVAIGAFVVDFYCSSERLAIEVDGPIHEAQQEADRIRQELIESLDIHFVRLSNDEVEYRLESSLNKIRRAFGTREPAKSDKEPLPLDGGGVWGGGDKSLKDRTLTNLYNAMQVYRGQDDIKIKRAAGDFAPRLDELHQALDHAVCDAYGWEHAILEDEEEILRRLLALNLQRAASQ